MQNKFLSGCVSVLPVSSQRSDSDLDSTRLQVVIRQIGILHLRRSLYTRSTDELMADFHCWELNKVLKSRGNPVGLKYLP